MMFVVMVPACHDWLRTRVFVEDTLSTINANLAYRGYQNYHNLPKPLQSESFETEIRREDCQEGSESLPILRLGRPGTLPPASCRRYRRSNLTLGNQPVDPAVQVGSGVAGHRQNGDAWV
jgi:hypothetical protein